MMMTTTTNIW